jgi:hypothetical protein
MVKATKYIEPPDTVDTDIVVDDNPQISEPGIRVRPEPKTQRPLLAASPLPSTTSASTVIMDWLYSNRRIDTGTTPASPHIGASVETDRIDHSVPLLAWARGQLSNQQVSSAGTEQSLLRQYTFGARLQKYKDLLLYVFNRQSIRCVALGFL